MSILFDLDGTLVDTAPDFVQAINVLLVEDGKPELAPQALHLVRIATSHSLPALVEAGFDVKYDHAACVVSGDTTAHFKPHPEPLLHACKQIKLSPNNCIYIGDAERDIIAGKAAGMTTIGALFGYIEDVESAKQWKAHHYIHHVDEILPWYELWLQTSR